MTYFGFSYHDTETFILCCFNVGYCVFIDAEHALDPSLAETIGVKTENLLLAQPDCGEQALSLVDTLIRSGSVDVVVVDSVSNVFFLVHTCFAWGGIWVVLNTIVGFCWNTCVCVCVCLWMFLSNDCFL